MQSDEMIGQVLGHYRIVRSLGFGGAATVFLAEDINLKRDVAVKVFQPKDTSAIEDFLRRFEREARVLARLDHPNILPVYDFGEQNGIAYLVMPHMSGGSLREYLRQHNRVPAAEAVRLIGQILNALQYAHDRNLIHRDIKPGNMLFKADGTLMLSDFGLVKVLSTSDELLNIDHTESLTAHSITGTPDYMAPEQIQGRVAQASDIYAVGIVLYEMLTGQRPFNADNYVGTLMKHLYEPPRPLRSLNPQISPALEAAVMRAIEKEPARRYARAADMRMALEQAITHNPQGMPTFQDDSTTLVSSTPLMPLAPSPHPVTPPSASSFVAPPAMQAYPSGNVSNTPSGERVLYNSYQQASGGQPPYAPYQSQPPIAPQRQSQPTIIIALLLIILVLIIGLGSLLYAQGVLHISGPGSTPTALNGSATANPGSTVTTAPVGNVVTACPVAGTARAAIMSPLAVGTHQNLVYIVNEGTIDHPTFGTLKRRDATANVKAVEFSRTPDTYISEAQVSQDGQWVLFTAKVAGQAELRMIRMDGQGLQTLYCAPSNQTISNTQWSFNQKMAVFNLVNQSSGQPIPTTYLLDLTTGNVQVELAPQGNQIYFPVTWLDETRVYLKAIVPGSNTPPQLYLLDTQKGANQPGSNLQPVMIPSSLCGSFDTSYDVKQLFISTCSVDAGQGPTAFTGPSTITVQSTTGGASKTIATIKQAVVMIRAVNPTTLLLLIENHSGDTSQNGLWKMNTDGSGLIRLTTDTNSSQSLCPFTQYAWSNLSRDGSMYALQEYIPQASEYKMEYGSLNGGAPTVFADISDGTQLFLAGWVNF